MGVKLNGSEVEFKKLTFTLIDKGTTTRCKRASGTATYWIQGCVSNATTITISFKKDALYLSTETTIECHSIFTKAESLNISQLVIENIQLISGTSVSDASTVTFVGTTSWSEDDDNIYCTLTLNHSSMGTTDKYVFGVLYDIKYGSPVRYLCTTTNVILSREGGTHTSLTQTTITFNVASWSTSDNNSYNITRLLNIGEELSTLQTGKFRVVPCAASFFNNSQLITTNFTSNERKIIMEV